MRSQKLNWAEHDGWRYYANGRVENVIGGAENGGGSHSSPQDCNVTPASGSRHVEYCYTPSTPPPTTTIIWNGSGMNFTTPGPGMIVYWNNSGGYYGTNKGNGPKFSGDTTNECNNPVDDLREIGSQVAEYIEANGSRFSAAIYSAAMAARNNWLGTGLGVAASAEFAASFLGIVFAGCTIADILAICAAVGITLFFVWELMKCLGND